MKHALSILLVISFSLLSLSVQAQGRRAVVVDSVSHQPLAGASVFSRQGNAIGMTDARGRLPHISARHFPVTLRYLGFKEKTFDSIPADTVMMAELTNELPEVVIESRQHKVLHMLAYVREYSTLSTYSDTVFLFREKMVDFMLTPDGQTRFKGWAYPRVLKSKSYYRFTDPSGLDSVSNRCNQHFSWSDWIEAVPSPELPLAIRCAETATDTVMGKYSPTEIWNRTADRVTVNINVLADTTSRKWARNLSAFFKENLDFESFRLRYNYADVVGDTISPADLSAYSFSIESNGRGREMFRFNKTDEPFFVSTFGEVYILDKEYITVKEAKKWDSRKFDTDSIEIIEPMDAPELQPAIMQLVARVNAIDHDGARLGSTPDHSLIGRGVKRYGMGKRALTLLKQLTGITYIRSHRNFDRNWDKLRKRSRPRPK